MNKNAEYIALHLINKAITTSIYEIEGSIESCGKLDHPDMKLSEKAKSYFSRQTDDYQEAVKIARGFQREINDRLWANIKSSNPGDQKP